MYFPDWKLALLGLDFMKAQLIPNGNITPALWTKFRLQPGAAETPRRNVATARIEGADSVSRAWAALPIFKTSSALVAA